MAEAPITVKVDGNLASEVERIAGRLGVSPKEFVDQAIRRAVLSAERQRVDAEFARMKDDAAYQETLRQLEVELSPASDAAWQRLD